MGVTWVLSFSLGKFQWGWVKHNPVRLSNFIDPHISEKTLALARAKFDHWWCPGSWFGYGMLWPYDVVSGSNSSQPSRPSDVVRWFMPRIQPSLFAAASSWALDQGSVRYLSNRRPAFILNQPSRTARHSTANPSLFQNMEYRQIQFFLMFVVIFFLQSKWPVWDNHLISTIGHSLAEKWNLHAESGLAPLIHWSLQASHCLRGACGAMRFLMLAFINGSMPKGWKCLGRPPRRALLQKGPWDIMGPVRSMLHHGTHLKHAENAA